MLLGLEVNTDADFLFFWRLSCCGTFYFPSECLQSPSCLTTGWFCRFFPLWEQEFNSPWSIFSIPCVKQADVWSFLFQRREASVEWRGSMLPSVCEATDPRPLKDGWCDFCPPLGPRDLRVSLASPVLLARNTDTHADKCAVQTVVSKRKRSGC